METGESTVTVDVIAPAKINELSPLFVAAVRYLLKHGWQRTAPRTLARDYDLMIYEITDWSINDDTVAVIDIFKGPRVHVKSVRQAVDHLVDYGILPVEFLTVYRLARVRTLREAHARLIELIAENSLDHIPAVIDLKNSFGAWVKIPSPADLRDYDW